MPFASNVSAAAETDTELIADPGDNKEIDVTGVTVSSAAANKVTFESGATVLYQLELGAQDSIVIGYAGDTVFSGTASTSVTYTTTATTATFVGLAYEIGQQGVD